MSIIKCVAAGALGYIVGTVVGTAGGALVGLGVNAAQEGCGVAHDTQADTFAVLTTVTGYTGGVYFAIKAIQAVMDDE